MLVHQEELTSPTSNLPFTRKVYSLSKWPLEKLFVEVYPKLYWESKDEQRKTCGIGFLDSFSSFIPAKKFAPRFYGTVPFKFQNNWPTSFFLPKWEFFQEKKQLYFAQNVDDSFPENPAEKGNSKPRLIQANNIPEFETWKNNIFRAQEEMQKKSLQKVVLARKSCFTFDQPISEKEMFHSAFNKKKNSFFFFYSPKKSEFFIGLSPERLYRRKNHQLTSEAIAGTSSLKDHQLIHSVKDQQEFFFVHDFIKQALYPLSDQLSFSKKPSILKTVNLQHLHTKFKAVLKKNINDLQILPALHPTPATLGFPRSKAYDFLKLYESFPRENYTGSLGWMSSDESEFTVGIRSCVSKSNHIYLYAGTGIVSQSDPRKEWDELEMKIQPLKEIVMNNA